MPINNQSELLASMRRVLDNDGRDYELFMRGTGTTDRDAAQARATVAAMSGAGEEDKPKPKKGAGSRDAAGASKAVREASGLAKAVPTQVAAAALAQALDSAMGRLERMTSGASEVVVKISNKQAGKGAVGRHLSYISRHGKLELENQEQLGYRGADEVKSILGEWRIADKLADDPEKDTLNIIFSMSAGIDPELERDAVRDALAEIFKGHRYVFVLHDKEHDPKTKEHPHCHVVVQKDGFAPQRGRPKRLRHGPRELAAWRSCFAEQLRKRGVDAEATRRYARGKFAKPERQAIRQMKDRGQQPLIEAAPSLVKSRAVQSKAKSKASALEKFTAVQREMLELADGIERFMPMARDLAVKVRIMVQRSAADAAAKGGNQREHISQSEQRVRSQRPTKARRR